MFKAISPKGIFKNSNIVVDVDGTSLPVFWPITGVYMVVGFCCLSSLLSLDAQWIQHVLSKACMSRSHYAFYCMYLLFVFLCNVKVYLSERTPPSPVHGDPSP